MIIELDLIKKELENIQCSIVKSFNALELLYTYLYTFYTVVLMKECTVRNFIIRLHMTSENHLKFNGIQKFRPNNTTNIVIYYNVSFH